MTASARSAWLLRLAVLFFCLFDDVCAFQLGCFARRSRPLRQTQGSLNEFTSFPHSTTLLSSTRPVIADRRQALVTASAFLILLGAPAAASTPRIDVNNALAREYTAFPGLFPTVATKVFKNRPYTSKQEVYNVLNDLERERLKQYDKAIVIKPVDERLLQFKTSQICKYECGGRVSSEYRDDQIKAVQSARR